MLGEEHEEEAVLVTRRKQSKAFRFAQKKLEEQRKRELSKAADKAERKQINSKYNALEEALKVEHFGNKSGEANGDKGFADSNNVQNTDKLKTSVKEEGHAAAANISDGLASFHFETNAKKHANYEKKQRKLRQKHQQLHEAADKCVSNFQDFREAEREAILDSLKSMNMTVYDIPADGHCLFRAIAHQLGMLKAMDRQVDVWDYQGLRELAADYIYSHRQEFIQFFSEGYNSEEKIKEYCETLKNSAEWGGEMELHALASALHYPICVHGGLDQAFSYSYGECDASIAPIRLSYHRYAYALGEHYNSVVPMSHVVSDSF